LFKLASKFNEHYRWVYAFETLGPMLSIIMYINVTSFYSIEKIYICGLCHNCNFYSRDNWVPYITAKSP
jgi:hypothetical protein